MKIASLPVLMFLTATAVGQTTHFTMGDFETVEKIDVHAHIMTEDLDFVALASKAGFRFVNTAVWSNADPAVNRESHRTMFLQYAAAPDRTAPVSSFPLENWDDVDWSEQTISYLDQTFAKGAVGVKVWKNIGMELRNQAGELVMIDDPQFDPVFDHLEARNIVLLGHLGEPKNCWLPLETMTTNNDREYFSEHPKYHMYLHPELPSYEQQIAARDRMLDKHPGLTFIACHLASLEWSIEEMTRFVERYPNAYLDLAARMGQIQFQSQHNRQQMIDFMTRFQDRIVYGTDIGVGPQSNVAERFGYVHQKWLRDWKYFNTDQQVDVPELDDPVQGLALPKTVIERIYWRNPRHIFPNSW